MCLSERSSLTTICVTQNTVKFFCLILHDWLGEWKNYVKIKSHYLNIVIFIPIAKKLVSQEVKKYLKWHKLIWMVK